MENYAFRKDYLTTQASAILNSRVGYRDDSLFPGIPQLTTKKTNPFDVVITEILSCGKYEICNFLQIHYTDILSKRDYRLLDEVIGVIKTIGYPIMDFDKKEQLERIASNVIGDCDYCVWLCASPEDIFSYYVKEYIPKAEKIQPGYADECPDYRVKESMSLEEYSEKYVSRIVIPDNSDIRFLCDLGRAGSLVAYKREDNNSDRL